MTMPQWEHTRAAIWRTRRQHFHPVHKIDPVSLENLIGLEHQKKTLMDNTSRFARGGTANHALLWGARGTGKSALVKAVFNVLGDTALRLIQLDRDGLDDLPELIDEIRTLPWRFIVFCDDLTFARSEPGYNGLKTVLEGSIEAPADNLVIYATSNRRHLLPEYASDNDGSQVIGTELHYGDAAEEALSLVDRFGLSLSFYPITQPEYLSIVDSVIPVCDDRDALHRAALQFAQSKSVRSGRTARQFAKSLSGF